MFVFVLGFHRVPVVFVGVSIVFDLERLLEVQMLVKTRPGQSTHPVAPPLF